MELRSFGHEDVTEAKELSDAVGWNQVESDWHRIITIQPDGCLGAWEGGRLVGTTTFVTYGKDLAWIGMVLVRSAYQGRGVGTRLVRTAMDALTEREISVVGLDATEIGRPLYEREGFTEVVSIIRWNGKLCTPSVQIGRTERIRSGDSELVVQFDRRITSTDRGQLLKRLVEEEEVIGFSVPHGDEALDGYIFLRPGRTRWQVGPLVAHHEDAAKQLLSTASHFLNGRDVVLDAVEGFGFSALLEGAGLEVGRRLTRMTAPQPNHLLTSPLIVAAAGFEWG